MERSKDVKKQKGTEEKQEKNYLQIDEYEGISFKIFLLGDLKLVFLQLQLGKYWLRDRS